MTRGHFIKQGIFVLTAINLLIGLAAAQSPAPGGGVTMYVSKQGDNTDGRSWATAYTTIQAALSAVPDANGGHRIIVRPDTYMEANLFPAYKGAKDAYNVLVGDCDGVYGSGATGTVMVDSGDAEKGFKSYDWWGNIRSYSKGWSKEHTEETFSAIGWDRWKLQRMYATGGDGGFFFDCTDHVEPFTVVVEDCVSIGRAFGGGVGNCLARADEPIVYRRCQLWALDWWGDTAAGYVRIENETMPDKPEVLFEDCNMVSPQCSFKAGNFGFKTSSRVLLRRCNLVTLNFSQPPGTPTDGIIQSVEDGKYLHVELEDCTLMGYKVFGVRVNKDTDKDIQYTLRGNVRAYVQFQQDVPKGFQRLTTWPAATFAALVPPSATPQRPQLVKLPVFYGQETMESTPVVCQDTPMLVACTREASSTPDVQKMHLSLWNINTGKETVQFGEGHSFASAYMNRDEMHVWAAAYSPTDWTQDLYHFTSTDLKTWSRELAIARDGDEHLFNSSVCKDYMGYVMAYESNKPVSFCFKFARSKDLKTWEKIPGLTFTGTGGEYSACPVLRYFAPYYYVIYLHAAIPGHNGWVSFMGRSKDLETWELSPFNPILEAGPDEGVNNSDVDLFEWQDRTWVFYANGNQATWGKIGCALYDGPMQQFYAKHFPEGVPCVTVSAKQ